MIPKVLNYIWLSNDPLDDLARDCIATWRKSAPEFEIRRWSLADFDIDAMPPFVREAIAARKWAFACDYLRLWILDRHGGWYLDADVVVARSPSKYSHCRYVTSFELWPGVLRPELVDENGDARADFVSGMGLQSAVQGCEPGHPFVRACLEWYAGRHFALPDGGFGGMLAPHIQALVARKFGFKYRPEQQFLSDGIVILAPDVFATSAPCLSARSEMVHVCSGSWKEAPKQTVTVAEVERRLREEAPADDAWIARSLLEELEGIRTSESYRLGLFLTAPLRRLKRMIVDR